MISVDQAWGFGRMSIFVLGMCAMSCSPVVVVVHQDSTREAVDVWVDRQYLGQLEPGEELSEKVERGHHLIEARPRGEQTSPWTPDGKGWSVFVDRGTILTLLPVMEPEKEAGAPPGESKKDKKEPLPIVVPAEGTDRGEQGAGARIDYKERAGILGDNPY